jgi:hypothetical protein
LYWLLAPLLPIQETQDSFRTREGKVRVRPLNLVQIRDGKFGLKVSICSTHSKILDDVVLEYQRVSSSSNSQASKTEIFIEPKFVGPLSVHVGKRQNLIGGAELQVSAPIFIMTLEGVPCL